MRTRLLVLILGCLIISVIAATAAHASCAGPQGPLKKRLTTYSTVFVGTVTDTAGGGRLATVKVEAVWRGEVPPTATVAGGETGPGVASSVDRSYEEGNRYLFTPYDFRAGRYNDNICTDTQRWTRKIERLRPSGATPVDAGGVGEEGTPATSAPSPVSPAPQAAPDGGDGGTQGMSTSTLLVVGAAIAAAATAGVLFVRGLRAGAR